MLWTEKKEQLYQWFKRYEAEWTWVTMVVDATKGKMHLYLNGRESSSRNGTGTESPIQLTGLLKKYGSEPFLLGKTTTQLIGQPNPLFKGQIADLKLWNRALKQSEVKELHNTFPTNGLVLHYDFENVDFENKKIIENISNNEATFYNIDFKKEKISIPDVIIPHRKNGRFFCLPHKTEGLINEGGMEKWAKGETTARNERRYVLEMQQGKIDYKTDGMSNVDEKFNLIGINTIYEKHKMINVKCVK